MIEIFVFMLAQEVISKLEDVPILSIVELPCFINNPSTGIDILGGPDAIRKALKTKNYFPNSLQVKLSKEDPLRQGLLSSRVSAPGIVLQVRKKVVIDNNGTATVEYDIKVIGKVYQRIVFQTPADFQFLPSTTSTVYTPSNSKILETIPRPFVNAASRDDHVSLFLDRPIYTHDKRKRKDTLRRHYLSIKFGDPIPMKPVKTSVKRRNKTKSKLYFETLKDLFQRRPMWKRFRLEQLEDFRGGQYCVREMICFVAFYFSHGPWAGLWCRFGYDPATDPKAAIFQTITVSLKHTFQSIHDRVRTHVLAQYSDDVLLVDLGTLATERKAADEVETQDSHSKASQVLYIRIFDTILAKQCCVQVCDIDDDNVFHYVSSLRRSGLYLTRRGWLPLNAIHGIRKRVLDTIERRVQQFINTPALTAAPLSPSADLHDTLTGTRAATLPSPIPGEVLNGLTSGHIQWAGFDKYAAVSDPVRVGGQIIDDPHAVYADCQGEEESSLAGGGEESMCLGQAEVTDGEQLQQTEKAEALEASVRRTSRSRGDRGPAIVASEFEIAVKDVISLSAQTEAEGSCSKSAASGLLDSFEPFAVFQDDDDEDEDEREEEEFLEEDDEDDDEEEIFSM